MEVTGATTLTAATGAETSHGGSVKFNSHVTANTATVARAYGSGGGSGEGGAVIVNESENGVVNYTGTTMVDKDSSIAMYLTSGSVWHLTSNSDATTLSNSGRLDMTAENGDSKFSTLTLSHLYGDGSIYMDIEEADTGVSSDVIYVTGNFSNTQYVTLFPVNSQYLTEASEGTVLLYVRGTNGGSLAVQAIEAPLFWQEYSLASQIADDGTTTEWYIDDIGTIYYEDTNEVDDDEDTGNGGGGNFLHLDVERSTGGDVDQEWYYKAGSRFTM